MVVITGDHRLPEIPMQLHLERYHVPLLIHAPMLRQPLRISSVSSHFDIAPSLQAMLARQYGWTVPQKVHWMGSGLDVHPKFRNLHVIPMKQTKTELVDLVSGEYALHRDQLLSLQDGLAAEPDPSAGEDLRQDLQKTLSAFKAKLKRAQAEDAWVRQPGQVDWVRHESLDQGLHIGQRVARFKGVSVSGLTVMAASAGQLTVRATFSQSDGQAGMVFVPLLVVTDANGVQKAEHSGPAVRLSAGESRDLTLTMSKPDVSGSVHFVSMVVSHPDTGKSIGRGQYHVAWRP